MVWEHLVHIVFMLLLLLWLFIIWKQNGNIVFIRLLIYVCYFNDLTLISLFINCSIFSSKVNELSSNCLYLILSITLS